MNLSDLNGYMKGLGHEHIGFNTDDEAAIDWAYFTT